MTAKAEISLPIYHTYNYKIFNHCYPGVPIQQIFGSNKSSKFDALSKRDCIVVIGQTNDIEEFKIRNKHCFLLDLLKYIESHLSISEHINIILSTIPYRYDVSSLNLINELIKDENLMIRELIFSKSHVRLLDLYLLQSSHHTRHGLYVIKKGKRSLLSKY